MDNINMKHKKSNVNVTKFGTLIHSLNDGYYYTEIVGVHAESQDKYNAKIRFKYKSYV